MTEDVWVITRLTVLCALASTILFAPCGLAVAWLLAKRRWPGKIFVETLVTFPLAAPPVVTGLFLLRIFGKHGVIGRLLHDILGVDIVFTWRAVVLALGFMSFPLLVRSARSAFAQVDSRLEEMARTLGAGEWRVFFTVSLPLAKRGVVAGLLLAFARALGEFGATIMVAGSIPGETSTLSLSIYQAVLMGDDRRVYGLVAISVGLSLAAVFLSEWLVNRKGGG
jgi:molybdate transport system permease protein